MCRELEAQSVWGVLSDMKLLPGCVSGRAGGSWAQVEIRSQGQVPVHEVPPASCCVCSQQNVRICFSLHLFNTYLTAQTQCLLIGGTG